MIQNQTLLTRFNTEAPFEGMGTELNRTKNMLKFVYDFAVQGGAVGTVNLLDDQGNPAFLPVGAMITRSFLRTVTALTSGGSATIAFSAIAAGDVLAAAAYTGFSGANVLVEGVSTGTAANMKGPVTSTAYTLNGSQGGNVTATIAVATLTAGKISGYIEYVL